MAHQRPQQSSAQCCLIDLLSFLEGEGCDEIADARGCNYINILCLKIPDNFFL